METQLRVKWEGSAPGLLQKRLSISAFGKSFDLLLAALRRIATGITTAAFEDRQARFGRFSNAARQLDIEITDLVKESSGFDGIITLRTLPGDNLPLFDNLAQSASKELLEAIHEESRGVLRNWGVRKYLESLPQGLARQTYTLHQNGSVTREVIVSELLLAQMPEDLPFLAEYTGQIVGVGFEPGKPEVRIKTENGATVAMVASSDQVEKALMLRHSAVKALVVAQGGPQRLLILRDQTSALNVSTRENAVFRRWAGVLKRLAQ